MRAAGVLLGVLLSVGLAGNSRAAASDAGVAPLDIAVAKIGPPAASRDAFVCCQDMLKMKVDTGTGARPATSSAPGRTLDRVLMVLLCLGLVGFQLLRSHRSIHRRVASYEP